MQSRSNCASGIAESWSASHPRCQMPDPRTKSLKHRILLLLALTTLLIFLATAFRAGFQRDETDFPNYYTAAVLVRKGEPLHKFYDWTWFAREMDKAGLTQHIGNYTPHTPLTMLPMVALAGL